MAVCFYAGTGIVDLAKRKLEDAGLGFRHGRIHAQPKNYELAGFPCLMLLSKLFLAWLLFLLPFFV